MTTIFPFPPPNTQARGIIRDRSRSRRKRIRDCIIDPLYYCFWCSSNKKQQQNRRRNRRCLSSWSWILSLLGSILYFLALNRYLSTININDHHHPHHKLQILPQQQQQQQHKQLEATDYLLPSQYSLRLGQQQQQQQQQQHIMSNNIRNNQTTTRYLIYRPPFEAAQGIGNLMNGLLAAHMLGEEYNRIVCVSDEWEEFLLAFDIVTPECHNRQEVSLLFMNNNDDGGGGDHHHYYYHNNNKQMLWILNFGRLPINECKLRDQLQSPDISVLYLVANTYPQWPTAGNTLLNYNKNNSNQLFYRYYKPRKELINILPWKEENPKQQQQQPPNVVVHLRQPDDVKLDPRNGLDDESLQLLGEILPEDDTYLVTNQVDYYEYFNTNFGWSHPSWDIVTHSAKMDVIWTPPTTTSGNNQSKPTTTSTSAATVTRSTQQQKHEHQILQVWSDWLTLYSANIVYHTSSDFSMSAIHWSGISESYTIQGTTTINRNIDNDDKKKNEQGKHHHHHQQQQQRELILEPDRGGGGGHSSNTLPLSKRSIHSLQNCNLHPSGLDGLGYVLNLDDEYHDDELEDDWDLQKQQQQQQLRRRPHPTPLVVQAAQHNNKQGLV